MCIFLHFQENACILRKMHAKIAKSKFSDIRLASSKGLFFKRPNEMVTIPGKWFFISSSNPHMKTFPCLAIVCVGGLFCPTFMYH